MSQVSKKTAPLANRPATTAMAMIVGFFMGEICDNRK